MIDDNTTDARPEAIGAGTPPSLQVSWHEAYLYAERIATQHGLALDHTLIAGTARWVDMSDDDARKLLSLLLGGVREALSNDAHQAAMADASRAIARSADWRAVARRQDRGPAYVPRRKEGHL